MKKNHVLPLLFFSLCIFIYEKPAHSQQTISQSGYLPSSEAYYSDLPLVVPTSSSLALTLPDEVDNSSKIFFPRKDYSADIYIYDQTRYTASCQNVATTFYTYTYEVNRLRNLTSNTQLTRYAPNFSFNHLNHGYQGWQGYTSLEKVQKFLMESGAITDAEFDGPAQLDPEDSWRWPSGFVGKYIHARCKASTMKPSLTLPVLCKEPTP